MTLGYPSPLVALESGATRLPHRHNYVGGRFVEGGQTFLKRSPVHGREVARVGAADAALVDEAVRAARRALAGPWGRASVAERASWLDRIAQAIDDRSEALAAAESEDTGKPLSVARLVDIPRAAANFRTFAALIRGASLEAFALDTADGQGAINYAIRKPLGVVAVIVPWNLPLLLLTWKVAPALACGNAVVVKPWEETPSSATLLAEIIHELGLPAGVFNLVHGFGPNSTGEFLTTHPDVDGVTFTGESSTGSAIMRAVAPTTKPISFELGGKNAAVVFADADFEQALAGTVQSVFSNCGQVCRAGKGPVKRACAGLGASLIACVVLWAGATRLAEAAQAPIQDTPLDAIYVNGKVVTANQKFDIAQAMGVTRDLVTSVGTNEQVRALAGPKTRIIDLRGHTVVPGLGDSHLHNAGGGPGLDLSRTRTLADVMAVVRVGVSNTGPDDVVVSNSDWHESQLKEDRLPLRRDLDRVAPTTPVVLVRGGHEYILNSAALAKWSITKATPDPEGGQVSRYEDGEPNGELVDTARNLVKLPPAAKLTLDEQIVDQQAQHARLNAAGLTSIRYGGISIAQYRLFEEMKRRGVLTIRISALLFGPRGPTADAAGVRAVIEASGLTPNGGDEWVRVAGIKLMVDGGFEGGLMREPYAEPYGKHGAFKGIQVTPADRYLAMVKEINRLGWRAATHAVGDAAIEQVIAAYEAASAERSIVGKRWALEHGFLPADDHFERLKSLGVVLTAQNHLYLAGPSMARYWGPARAARVTPVRSYLDHGVIAAAGTDSGVVPYPPLWTFYHFVSRRTIGGKVMGADQKITRPEALRMATVNNAYLNFEETQLGSLEAGKFADFIVLSDDILTVPEARLEGLDVLLTVVGGKAVHARAGWGPP